MLPHEGQPVLEAGIPLGQSSTVVIMVHGRNAAPANILELGRRFERPNLTYLAPAAANRTWYPQSFMADLATNEPGVSSGLEVLRTLVERVETSGVPRARIVLAGFSQGACLVSEFAVRHASRFGGVLVFSGGAIGPVRTTWDRGGNFEDTPVFLGCSEGVTSAPDGQLGKPDGGCPLFE